jgi:L-malate glycosyltransferase
MLSVLLATRNRSGILRDVLESYCALEQPPSGWKLIVVDNGSTDQSPQVIASFLNRLPLHTIIERRVGKNFALNTGLALVEGDLTVLTDDDAFPRRDWLTQLRQAADSQPAYSMFGGAVVPRWEAPPPHWVQWVEIGPMYTLTEPTLKRGPIPSYLVFGPNMAVRTEVFRSGERFDPSIGPRGRDYAMGSETQLTCKLEQQGHRAWHVPDAVVEHFVRKGQLKKAWVMRRAIRYGRGQYRLWSAAELEHQRLFMRAPRYLLTEIYQEAMNMAKAWMSLESEAFFRSRWQFNFLRGKITEARLLVREQLRGPQLIPSQIDQDRHF